MVYEYQMQCTLFQTKTCNRSEFIATSFNLGTRNAIYVITLYRSHSTKITKFLEILENLINDAPIECPIIILGDFNVDLSNHSTQHYEIEKILDSMNKNNLKQKKINIYYPKNSLIDHIWSNIAGTSTKYGVTDAYWPDHHKPIYCVFKLPSSLSKYTRQLQSFRFT